MNIYVANLEAYNAGELIGKWLALPMELDELKSELKAISNAAGYVDSELAIHDFECFPFAVSEFSNILEINEKSKIVFELETEYGCDLVWALINYFDNLDETISVLKSGNFAIWDNCDSMAEVAMQFAESCYNLEAMGNLANYIDYEMLGNDLDLSGKFIGFDGGYIELI